MKLRVNASYRTRDGDTLKIVSVDNDSSWPYTADNGEKYKPDGSYYDSARPSLHDLVERVALRKPAIKNTAGVELPTLQLEDGKSYWTRDGLNVVRIKRRHTDFKSYPWEATRVDGDGRIIEGGLEWWTDTGRYYDDGTNYKWDLVQLHTPNPTVDLFTKIREDLNTLIAHMAELEKKLDAQDA